MRLYVLRHGDAVETTYYQDHERPLSEPGKRQIRAVAHFFQVAKIKPDLILTSPLTRARETSTIVREALGIKDSLTTDALISSNTLRDLVREINAHAVESMLLVGHEPQLSGLISTLTGGDEQFRVEMKKASLACLETQLPLKRGHAVLTWLLAPSLFDIIR